MKKTLLKAVLLFAVTALVAILLTAPAFAALPATEPKLPEFSSGIPGGSGSSDPNITLSINGESADTVKIILLMTILSVLPSILLMMTCFTRIVIVFSLLRNAMGLQQTPPAQVIIGLSLFLTLFIMNPVITEVNETAYKPYSQGSMDTEQFLEVAQKPVKLFMLKQTKQEDINLFFNLRGGERPDEFEDYPMTVVIPAFVTSEIKTAFTIGFLLYVPFLIIDMVVASALMSMGMMMLPPITISMPFKLMLFVLVDGWGLLIKALVATYHL